MAVCKNCGHEIEYVEYTVRKIMAVSEMDCIEDVQYSHEIETWYGCATCGYELDAETIDELFPEEEEE